MSTIVATPQPAVSGQAASAPGFVGRLLRRPLAVACLAWLAVVVVVAIVAPIALPQIGAQHAGNLLAVRQGPSSQHLLGTDSLGRDVLDRLLVGTRVTVLGVLYALAATLVLGVPLGVAAGYFGGTIDRVVGWLADIAFSLPAIILIVVLLSVFPQSMLAAMMGFGVLTAPGLMRVVRSATLPIARELYVAAARVSGMSRLYIVTRHVLPRIASPIIVQASLVAAAALLVQTGLAFLGLVAAPPQPSWGGMVSDAVQVLSLDSWLIWPPGIAIALTALALGLLGDVLRDVSTESWAQESTLHGSRRRRAAGRPRTMARGAGTRAPQEGGAPQESGAPHEGGAPQESGAPHEGGAPQESDALLSVAGLTVALDSTDAPRRLIEHVSFDVAAGEIVGVVGESGCGKTITAMAILGLLPGVARIQAGSVAFAGLDLTQVPEPQLRRIRGKEIALVSQEPMTSLNPTFRIGWQLSEALRRHHDIGRRQASRRAVELLERVLIDDPQDVARRYPHELSGGMAQRVAIARALAGEPRLLIADEPTTALDVTTQAEILDLLRKLQSEHDMAVILITHDLAVVADVCRRMVVMYAGQVVERGAVDDVFATPLQPYTRALLASNPHNSRRGELLATIPGTVPEPGTWPEGCHFAARCPLAGQECLGAAIPMAEPAPGRQTRCIHFDQLAGAR